MLGLEALGYGCNDNGLVFSINAHMWTSEVPIWTFGTARAEGPVAARPLRRPVHRLPHDHRARSRVRRLRHEEHGRKPSTAASSSTGGRPSSPTPPWPTCSSCSPAAAEGIGPYGITAFLVEAGHDGTRGRRHARQDGPPDLADGRRVPGGLLRARRRRSWAAEATGGEIFQTSMRWERACIMASQVGRDAPDDGGLRGVRAPAPAVRQADRQVRVGRRTRSPT